MSCLNREVAQPSGRRKHRKMARPAGGRGRERRLGGSKAARRQLRLGPAPPPTSDVVEAGDQGLPAEQAPPFAGGLRADGVEEAGDEVLQQDEREVISAPAPSPSAPLRALSASLLYSFSHLFRVHLVWREGGAVGVEILQVSHPNAAGAEWRKPTPHRPHACLPAGVD